MAARGDSASLRQNAIARVASDFSGIESAVKENQAALAASQPSVRPPYLLKVDGTATLERAEFLCGVFGANGQTANSAVFMIPNLAPGNYGVLILDVPSLEGPRAVTFVLQQQNSAWKLAGFNVKQTEVGGHDGNWFAARAREFKARNQLHNAWFYFLEARDLLVPVAFMSTLATDKIYDEAQSIKPNDLPDAGDVVLTAGGKTYKLITIAPLVVGKDFDVLVTFHSPDISDTAKAFQDDTAVMKALVAKYPEFRSGFSGVVARAVDPSGKDYGALLPMKEIK
ncbi:MAG: hypothetical protein JOY93_12005 [Acidobacteriales bacterium]|nr:hypothetical protein [Terriglobales bacterium]